MPIVVKHDATIDEKVAAACKLSGIPVPTDERELRILRALMDVPLVCRKRRVQGRLWGVAPENANKDADKG